MSSLPVGTISWEEAPPEAITAWRECCRHQSGGLPPAEFACSGWIFRLGDNGKRYYPVAVTTAEEKT